MFFLQFSRKKMCLFFLFNYFHMDDPSKSLYQNTLIYNINNLTICFKEVIF